MDTEPMTGSPADLKQHMTRYKAPPGLERRIRHVLEQESRGPGWLDATRAALARWMPLGASFACGVLVAALAMLVHVSGPGDDDLEQHVVASHVRSLMAAHLTDVASSDRHTVKPWFTGKLDFAPPVVDLAQQGFPLVGGRLDYLRDRPVAALVYQRRGHMINVFVMPVREVTRSARRVTVQHGYNLAEWQAAGMHYWAVSDLGRDELLAFTVALAAGS